MSGPGVVARSVSPRGETVLRRRADGALELRVNGVFVMDDVETGSERRLATASLAAAASPRRVLVAGLGLGITLRAVLASGAVEQVMLVELEPALVDWLRADLVPGGAAALADPRVAVRVGDVAETVRTSRGGAYDVVLLDVDNGPDHLVHDANTALYRPPFLRRCRDALAPGGALVVWSMAESPALHAALTEAFDRAWTEPVPVRLGARAETYWLHLGAGDPPPPH